MTSLEEELTNRVSEFDARKLAAKIVKDKALQKELFACFFHGSPLLSSRAAWVLSHAHGIDQQIIKPYEGRMLGLLERDDLHPGVTRNILRIYQTQPIPEAFSAQALETCYSFVKSASQPPAIKAFAITVIFQVSRPYPELLDELKTVLQDLLLHENPAAILSRAKNTLKAIEKIMAKK